MAKVHKPVAGSRAYRPLKRAKKAKPRVHSWPEGVSDSKVLGFTAYKAGMTHCIAVDEKKNSATAGTEVFVPVTILEAPPMKVVGVRLYTTGYDGEKTFTDIWCETPEKDVKKRMRVPKKKSKPDKKIAEAEKKIGQLSDVRLIAHTQPKLTHSPQKKPDVMELGLTGELTDKLGFAKEKLGGEITVNDVFQENTYVDVTSVTKGKGFQGVVKRYGVKRQPRKASGKRRHLGTGGSWTPTHKLWVEPQPGQMGYHTRTEYNKLILKIGQDGSEVTPKGGFLRYGPVKTDYMVVYGSIPGPSKRIVRLTYPRRTHKDQQYTIKHIDTSSKQGI